MLTALKVFLVAAVAWWATKVPTKDELEAAFEAGQKFYASGAYDQALEQYDRIIRTESALLREERVQVTVGELTVGIREAALFQSGNAYFKMAEEARNRARRTRDEAARTRWMDRAAERTQRAVDHFLRVESESAIEALQSLALNRAVVAQYDAGAYDDAIREGRRLIARYPESKVVAEALYNIAWSTFKKGELDASRTAFEELIARVPTGYRSDRALFQIGESYYREARYREAIPYYQRLVDQQDVASLTEQDLLRMRREKLAGLVDETAFELAAKAQIKVGICYAKLGAFDRAVETLEAAVRLFSQERRLMEDAYLELAHIFYERGDLEGSIRIYNEAIDQMEDPVQKARMQFLKARRYYDAGAYEKAVREYRLYTKAYDQVADAAGFSLDEARYRIGRSLFDAAGQKDRPEEARRLYEEARTEYSRTLEAYPQTHLIPTLRFNLALCEQMIGTTASNRSALKGFRALLEEFPDDPYAESARFQIARILYRTGEYMASAQMYRDILESTSDSSRADMARYELGIALRDGGEQDAAVDIFLSVRRTSDLFAQARLAAAQILLDRKAFDRVLDLLSRDVFTSTSAEERIRIQYLVAKAYAGKEAFDRAAERFTQVLEGMQRDDPKLRESARYGRGVALLMSGRYKEALADMDVLQESRDPKIRTAALRMAGSAHIKLNQERQAVKVYESLMQSVPPESEERAEYMMLLGELYYELKAYRKVVELCEQILSLELSDVKTEEQPYSVKEKAYYLLGDAYAKLGEPEQTIAVYETAFERYPDSYYSSNMLFTEGMLLFQQGDYAKAVEVFERFVRAFPEDPNRLFAEYYMGYAFFNASDFDRAAVILERVGRAVPPGPVTSDALFRAGESFYNVGAFRRALDLYRAVYEDHPDAEQADDALYNSAWAYMELDLPDSAVVQFERFLERFPHSEYAANARFTLGDYFYNEGQFERALTEYKRVMTDYPDDPLTAKAPDLVEELHEIVAYQAYDRAMTVFNEALETNDRTRFEEAAALFEDIVKQYPGTESEIGALSNMGVCFEFLRRWRDAVKVYDQVLSRSDSPKVTPEALRFVQAHRDWIETNRL